MTRQEAVNFIRATNGLFFAIRFIKRSTNEIRTMNARTGVRKYVTGKGMAYDPNSKGLVVVFDTNAPRGDGGKGAYRMINVAGITEIEVKGEWQKVTD